MQANPKPNPAEQEMQAKMQLEQAKAQAEAFGAKLDEKLLGRTAPMMRYGMQ